MPNPKIISCATPYRTHVYNTKRVELGAYLLSKASHDKAKQRVKHGRLYLLLRRHLLEMLRTSQTHTVPSIRRVHTILLFNTEINLNNVFRLRDIIFKPAERNL